MFEEAATVTPQMMAQLRETLRPKCAAEKKICRTWDHAQSACTDPQCCHYARTR